MYKKISFDYFLAKFNKDFRTNIFIGIKSPSKLLYLIISNGPPTKANKYVDNFGVYSKI